MNIRFYLIAKSVGTDEMPHYAAFHLGLHGLSKYVYLFAVSRMKRFRTVKLT